MIAQVGAISANNDEEIGRIIAEAMEKVGMTASSPSRKRGSMETSSRWRVQIDRGFSPYFVTDLERMGASPENAVVLIHEKKIPT